MFLFKRIITLISVILGGASGIIFLGFINWAFSLSLTFGHVFFYGVIGGAVAGVFTSYLVTVYLMKKAKRFVQNKLSGIASHFNTMRRV